LKTVFLNTKTLKTAATVLSLLPKMRTAPKKHRASEGSQTGKAEVSPAIKAILLR